MLMVKRKNEVAFSRIQSQLDFERAIVQLYRSGNFTTEHIAKNYGITVRSVQRIAKKWKVSRTIAEANKLMARHKHYHRIPNKLKAHRKCLLHRVRYALIAEHPFCTVCGATPADGIRLEVDHIDNDATNNVPENLQVLCQRCNIGKSHLNRWGIPEDNWSRMTN